MSGDVEKKSNGDNQSLAVSDLVGFVGTVFLFSTVFILMLLVFGGFDARERLICQEVLTVTMVVCFVLIWVCANALACVRFKPLVIPAVLGGLALCLSLIGVLPLNSIPTIILVGVGISALIAFWFVALFRYPEKSVSSFTSMEIVLGVLVCLVGACLRSDILSIYLALSYCVSLGCMIVLSFVSKSAFSIPAVKNRDSDQRSKIGKGSAIMLSITFFEFGFLVSICSSSGTQRFIACAVASIAVGVMFFCDSFQRRHISERAIGPFIVPCTVGSFVSLYLFNDIVQMICLCVLSVLCTLYYALGSAALIEHVHISHLSLLRAAGKARILDFCGMAIGIYIGWAAEIIASSNMASAAQLVTVVAIVYGFIAAFCHRARFPEKDMELKESEVKGAKNPWRRRCKAVGDRFGLTDRQQEVLLLVAQGRNAKYIEIALTISETTAQTHIRNIYRKTGVHSRQDLLDLIENTKLYGEE